jgi:hypothetical protein
MKVIKNKKDKILSFVENDKSVMELSWFYDEFIWTINGVNPVVVTRDTDETFYMGLYKIMNNDYQYFIDCNLSNKSDNRIQWLSDQCCDLEDKESTDRINILIIERIDESFIIRVENPYLFENGIRRSSYTIAFSPSGNGYMVKNIETGTNFQDDIVSLFNDTMEKSEISNSEEPQKKLKI